MLWNTIQQKQLALVLDHLPETALCVLSQTEQQLLHQGKQSLTFWFSATGGFNPDCWCYWDLGPEFWTMECCAL